MYMCILCFFAFSGFSFVAFFLQYFDTVGWVFLTCKTRLPYNLYCVGGDVKPCTIQSNPTKSTFHKYTQGRMKVSRETLFTGALTVV